MNNPHFSVILPVYNAENHLPATVRSVLAQSFRDFELIMIDDGSTDDSLSIMMAFAAEDQRIKLVSQENKGVSAARNLGLELARGTLVAFMDSDDMWTAHKLAIHSVFHDRRSEISASYAKIAFIGSEAADGHDAKTHSKIKRDPLTVDQVIAENPTCTMSNVVVSKKVIDAVGNFLPDMSYAEDQEWLARIANAGHLIQGFDAQLVDYRLSPKGLSVDLPAMYAGWRRLAAKYANGNAVRSAEAIFCRYLSRRALRAGAPAKTALAYALKGIRSDRSAFLDDPKRGWLTVLSAFAALAMPRFARINLFA
ncbi:glycosyltransferase [Parasphingorhabdus sp.]|uniref:glycosyltransferase family 2 protein n=1 Tax=Parasphingorhabdus sp. TaxID=2709688 RepID=UPI003266B9DC